MTCFGWISIRPSNHGISPVRTAALSATMVKAWHLLAVCGLLNSGCGGQDGVKIDRATVLRAEESAIVQRDRLGAALYRQSAVALLAPELEAELQELVDELCEVADCSIPCRVHLVNTPVINAGALASGDIFVLGGTLELIDNRDELAFVLAHEVAHVALQHGLRKARKSIAARERAEVTAALLGAVVGGAASGALASVMGAVPTGAILSDLYQQHVVSPAANLAARLAASVPTAIVASLMQQGISRYGRQAELQADEYGLTYAHKAGYDTDAGMEILRRMEEARARLTGPSAAPR